MNKDIVLREGSKVEDFSMESLLGGAASSYTFTCEQVFNCRKFKDCSTNGIIIPCNPNVKDPAKLISGLNIELSF